MVRGRSQGKLSRDGQGSGLCRGCELFVGPGPVWGSLSYYGSVWCSILRRVCCLWGMLSSRCVSALWSLSPIAGFGAGLFPRSILLFRFVFQVKGEGSCRPGEIVFVVRLFWWLFYWKGGLVRVRRFVGLNSAAHCLAGVVGLGLWHRYVSSGFLSVWSLCRLRYRVVRFGGG